MVLYINSGSELFEEARRGNIYVDKSKLKHNVSKNLNFIFVNGKKVPKSSLYDVDQNLIKITTNITGRFQTWFFVIKIKGISFSTNIIYKSYRI